MYSEKRGGWVRYCGEKMDSQEREGSDHVQ